MTISCVILILSCDRIPEVMCNVPGDYVEEFSGGRNT